jgi:hypothetical protein
MKFFFQKAVFFVMVLLASLVSVAQQNHFIYLQTENKQPFYVRIDKKLLSSSASGYLIIPKLQSSSHAFTLGFPKNEWPEQLFTCIIDKKDAGYILKDFGDKGWGLFSWQSLNVVMATQKKEDATVALTKKEEPEKPAEQPVVAVVVAVKQVEIEQPVSAKSEIPVAAEAKKEEATKPTVSVTKLLSNKTAEGIEMIFADAVNGLTDTVRIFFPIEAKGNTQEVNKSELVKTVESQQEKSFVIKAYPNAIIQEQIKKASEANKAVTAAVEAPANEKVPPQAEPIKKAVIQNSDCKSFAVEEDFMKLRKKMAAENSDEDMVSAARKVFKTKCFTVEQIKNLSVLFLNDSGKYKFFDAAYPFISDSHNFDNLQKLLSDEYYINRFKAMLRP